MKITKLVILLSVVTFNLFPQKGFTRSVYYWDIVGGYIGDPLMEWHILKGGIFDSYSRFGISSHIFGGHHSRKWKMKGTKIVRNVFDWKTLKYSDRITNLEQSFFLISFLPIQLNFAPYIR